MRLPDAPRAIQGLKRPGSRRPTSSTLVSLVVHLVLGITAWHAIQVPAVFERLLFSAPDAPPLERIEFVTLQPEAPPEAVAAPPVRGPVRSAPEPGRVEASAPLVAPTTVPTELPPVRLDAPLPTPGGTGTPGAVTGPLRGGAGPTRGVQPSFDDPRVWAPTPAFVYAPKTEKERLDSALIVTLMRHADSLAMNAYQPNKFERGDWTVERGGQKWGVDRQFVRLGPISIPTALLALLPLNTMQPNPIEMDRARANAFMRADILYHAQAAMNEEQFRQAVKAIRDRKERERRAAERDGSRFLGPVRSPGERPPLR